MVVLYSKEGQLANRLWQAAHFIANAIEYDYKLLHLGFTDYFEYFSESLTALNESGKCKISNGANLSVNEKILLKYINLSNKLEDRFKQRLPFLKKVYFHDYSTLRFYLSEAAFMTSAKKKVVLVDGWFYEDKPALTKHAGLIKDIFKPNAVFQNSILQLNSEKFKNYDMVVGVHIRRGDYETYNNGIWFYSNEEYINFMQQVLALKAFENKKTAFMICSNEELDFTMFHQFNIIQPTKNFIEDLYALALCNYIIGPPSTFSAWASFYGDVPVMHFYTKNTIVNDESFKVVDYAY